MGETGTTGLLSGLRVLEIGHFVAAPFCTRLLADLGAEVIKIEPPGGDPVRQWGKQINGQSLWWSLHGRNKRSVTLNLKHPKAATIVLRLLAGCDALVENFRPGQLDKLGLGEQALKAARPDLSAQLCLRRVRRWPEPARSIHTAAKPCSRCRPGR
jgi:crotonobetainyl-CoA:carnitine CoA-transferase CaiB-like acyl-CoA transferase